jgi:hypothetical protein
MALEHGRLAATGPAIALPGLRMTGAQSHLIHIMSAFLISVVVGLGVAVTRTRASSKARLETRP